MLNMLLPLLLFLASANAQYTADWASLDTRPIPQWYDDVKVGIFMHFGPYAVPGVEGEWFWMQSTYEDSESRRYLEEYFPPKWTYQNFGAQLTMEFFDPTEFARIVAESGAKYLVFTSKHHDGYCNWPSSYSYGWNSMDVGPKRNVLQELRDAFATYPDVHFGLYYSLYEWFHPLYLKDKANGYTTREFPTLKMLPEMTELINTFNPDILWTDGDWEAPSAYFGSPEFLAWLYNESPNKENIVVNDRWGEETRGVHGGFWTGSDRYNPGVLQDYKWENCMTIDWRSWGIRRNMKLSEIASTWNLISLLASAVSCGGNLLINVGPTKEGMIIPIFEERLKDFGSWMGKNGEGIYNSRPWLHQNDSSNADVWYTSNGITVYAIVLNWPATNTVRMTSPIAFQGTTVITMLGVTGELTYSVDSFDNALTVDYPDMSSVVQECGTICLTAQVLKMEGVIGRKVEKPSEGMRIDGMQVVVDI